MSAELFDLARRLAFELGGLYAPAHTSIKGSRKIGAFLFHRLRDRL